jgi:asparagine synthase (glutamine-hydrolysing)
MHYALEARSPFFDQELWEFAAALPLETRLHRGRLKAVLRELARRRVSARVARGRKRGFSVPVERWVADRWREQLRSHFRDSLLAREGWVRAGPILDALGAIPRMGRAPLQLWYLFVLEQWMRHERGEAVERASLAWSPAGAGSASGA